MKIFVTGGSGFLGARTVRRFAADGHEVYTLARSEASDAKVRALGALPVRGDLERPETLSLPSVDAVVHAAAYFRFGGPRAPYFRTNVAGTVAMLKAAERAGASTFVDISAGAVIMDGKGTAIHNADESVPTFPDSFSGYIASKAQGEAAALAADRPGFRTVAIRPPAVWGPGDPFSRELSRVVKTGQFAFINRGDYPYATCHVDNVVEAIRCALDRGPGGRAYFVADREPTTFRAFVSGIASAQGLSVERFRSIPYPLAFALGRAMELLATIRFATTDPPLTRTMVRMIGREFTVSDAAARRELGYVGKTSRADGLATYREAFEAPNTGESSKA